LPAQKGTESGLRNKERVKIACLLSIARGPNGTLEKRTESGLKETFRFGVSLLE